ncbi:ANTAR domain-containing protein [Bengtsoniella intestinalis]|uniref:ANTAR domain-containing response regulator n=1 Tax=Bengtsoniella intestinalis TaxID=3073143 RepID=UPI00391F4569
MNRIVVAFTTPEAQLKMSKLLESGGSRVAGQFATGAEVIRAIRKQGSGIVICGFKLKDMTANDLAQRLLGSAVVLCVSAPLNLTYCQGENIFRLPTPVVRGDFHASVNILHQLESQTLRHATPRRGDADKQTISSAKERLMESLGMSEEEAHRYLQKTSMDAGRPLVETAKSVLSA